MSGKLNDKIALITGATSGIGEACAKLFAEEGAEVIVCGRNEEKGNQVVSEIIKGGGKAAFVLCDVTKKESVEKMARQVKDRFSRLDILLNNAGVLRTGALEEITDEDWDLTYNTHVKSIIYTCQSFVEMLRESKGVILNNTSINGLHHYIKGAKSYMYASSKSAAIQLTNYLAKNYAPDIRVNCLCPGMTVTNLFTNRDFSRFNGCNLLNRMADPSEIAKVALFLCSDDSSFIVGATIVADGGETLL